MVELFLEGGPFMWPILILLLAGLGLVGERAYSLNQSKVDSDGFMAALEVRLNLVALKKLLVFAMVMTALLLIFVKQD